MKLKLKELLPIVKQAASEWMDDKAPTHGAALAYYTVFSMAPLLIISIGLAGIFLGHEAAQGQIFEQLRSLVGDEGGKAVQEVVRNANTSKNSSTIATIVGAATLLLGASTVFGQLQASLNTIWGVQPKPGRGLWGTIRDRVLSFGIVLVIGFLLLVSLVLTALVAGAGKWMGELVSGGEVFAQIANFALSLAVITALFAMIFKMLPDVKIAWHDVWIGAAITALLFVIGKSVLGIYLGKSSVGSSFGAAGSLIVLVVWVYYSAQILIFGAEFTQVYANRFGSHVEPTSNAERIDTPNTQPHPAPLAAHASRQSASVIPEPNKHQLKRELEETRSDVMRSALTFSEQVNVASRVRNSVKQKPATWLAVSGALGIALGFWRPRPRPVKLYKTLPRQADVPKSGVVLQVAALAMRSIVPALMFWQKRKASKRGAVSTRFEESP